MGRLMYRCYMYRFNLFSIHGCGLLKMLLEQYIVSLMHVCNNHMEKKKKKKNLNLTHEYKCLKTICTFNASSYSKKYGRTVQLMMQLVATRRPFSFVYLQVIHLKIHRHGCDVQFPQYNPQITATEM